MQKRRRHQKHSYTADKPIVSKTQDLLGRVKFAQELANDLEMWDGEDSLVIALYGPWGSGKTSVKNMLLEALQRKGRPSMEFNPWQFSGTGSISIAFFRELGIALRAQGSSKEAERLSKTLASYGGTLNLVGMTLNFAGKAMPWIGAPGGPAVEAVGSSIKAMAEVTKEGSEASKAKEEARLGLEAQKRELSKLLSHLTKPLLVVIDDMDRLTTKEILQIFQLVKANADFPNLIYLLLFERNIVTSALNEVSGNRGVEFLEKIVQVAYHIPQAPQSSVQRALAVRWSKSSISLCEISLSATVRVKYLSKNSG